MKPRKILPFIPLILLCFTFAFLSWMFPVQPREMPISQKTPKELEDVKIQEKLGDRINTSLTFENQEGKTVSLKRYFDGKKPVILSLNYYRCPQLCSLMLNGLVHGLKNIKNGVFRDFKLVTVSINPKEGSELAAAKRKVYLESLGKTKSSWDFLVGKQKMIDALTKQVGFKYKYVPSQKEYAHPAVVFILTPNGKLSQYLYGIRYKTRDLRFALLTASKGRIGSVIDRVFMSCFVYNSKDGKYTPFAFGIMRLGLFFVTFLLCLYLTLFWRKEWDKKQELDPGKKTEVGA